MDPALLNYLQQSQGQQQPNNNSYSSQQGQGQQQGSYNPFDAGISKAIASARESLGMTQKQQDKALRSSMFAFANNMSQQPKQRGFFDNFASVGQALAPALSTYDQEEENALGQNNDLANQILKYQGQEQDRQYAAEQQAWQRQHAENQLAETQRGHSLLDNFRRDKESKSHTTEDASDLDKILDQARDTIKNLGNKSTKNRAERIATDWLPGGYRNNKEQASIDTIGDVLKGQLFNAWGYRNKEEFKHVPTISSANSPEVNLENIYQIKKLLSNAEINPADYKMPDSSPNSSIKQPPNTVTMEYEGKQYWVKQENVQARLDAGAVLVNE